MPKMTVKGVDDVIKQLEAIGDDVTPIFAEAVFDGAGIVADEIKARLEQNLNSPRSVSRHGGKFDRKTTEPTGDLLASFGVAPIKRDENGNVNTKVGFHGYDRKGVANQLKARAMESGTSKLRKRPFVRPALNKCRKRVQVAMGDRIKMRFKQIQEKG